MITLGYKLQKNIEQYNLVDWRRITTTDLDYRLFLGDIYFNVNDEVFNAEWGWVPIIEFGTQLYVISHQIQDGREMRLEFTESEAFIRFVREKELILIDANFVESKAVTSLSDLRHSSTKFVNKIMKDLAIMYPGLQNCAVFQDRLHLVEG